ncbi:Flagellar biosynthesis protein FlhB [gamma proteobacterium IMCC1989]|nr:Flagellar biosynthesis protein FlhB [gamma proteobacterium IMCC1989]
MSESDSSQEKTEEATPKKAEKAKEDGQVPRSKELITTSVLLAGTIGLYLFGGILANSMVDIAKLNFAISREAIFDPAYMFSNLGQSFYDAFLALIPIFAVLLIAAIVGPIGLGGWLFSAKSMMPKMSRMNPGAGLKRMFSVTALIELAKALAKVVLIILLSLLLLKSLEGELMSLAYQDINASIMHSLEISMWSAIALSLVTIFIAIVDVPIQIWESAKKLKMTMQEVKDEMKDTDGKPEVKGRIRQLQQEIANRQMMGEVPEADVVITNPTHYSIAVKYKPEMMETPIVVAKGVDLVAFRIREVAKEHSVDIVESPILARAIYNTTKIDEPIPKGLYIAVAKVLAYVFQLRNFKRGLAQRPSFPYSVDVPDDLYFD